MIRDAYDVIIVGAGPAGSMTARYAAEGGASVLLLEKDRDIGLPVRCAEAVGAKTLASYVELNPSWIAHQLSGVRFTSPNGITFDVMTDNLGYILNRRIFDQELGRKAAQAGATVLTRAYVCGLILRADQVCGVKVRFPDGEKEIAAKIVVGADGVESRVGRWAGMRTNFALKDFESCYQVMLGGVSLETNCIHCYFGHDVAPGGYAWVFPKGADVANVGLGIAADRSDGLNAKDYLDRFLEKNFPNASILACVAGGVPAAKPLKKIHGPGVMLVGDAAAHTNPLTGGGISNAIAAGKLCGEVAARCVKQGGWSEADLAVYTKEYDANWGNHQRNSYRLKEAVHHIKDETLNKAAHILADLPPEKRTMLDVFTTTLSHEPGILIDIMRSFLS
ncbi:MAG: NAD(P)/FAD-dependent oxidoreductase [bacterium]|nr:NAD(P)/FAD-dependent oxidoreductase [bacterium]